MAPFLFTIHTLSRLPTYFIQYSERVSVHCQCRCQCHESQKIDYGVRSYRGCRRALLHCYSITSAVPREPSDDHLKEKHHLGPSPRNSRPSSFPFFLLSVFVLGQSTSAIAALETSFTSCIDRLSLPTLPFHPHSHFPCTQDDATDPGAQALCSCARRDHLQGAPPCRANL